MGVRVTEVDSAAAVTGSTDPTPVYQDENIKLFAIPLLPNVSSISSQGLPSDLVMEDVEPQSANLKRKRSPSPSSSSKRIDKEKSNRKRIGESLPENNHSPSPIPSFPPSPFREQSGVPGFSPFSLHGSDAQQWRRLTIENLFPIPMPTEPKPSKGKSGKHKKVEKKTAESVPVPEPVPGTSKLRDPTPSPLITPRSIRHAHVSAFRDKRLPTFNNIAGELASKQSICYIVEGPRVRGKFDLTKAVALGLKAGPLRSQITRGETVTFMVDDGKGGEVERTVQPEDCIGPSEPPHVSGCVRCRT